MSVATEFAPSVPIPPRARAARHLETVSAPSCAPLVEPRTVPARRAQLAPVALLRAPSRVSPVAPVRLTRRGVLALSMLVVALGIALVWVAALSSGSATAGRSAAAAGSGPATVTVRAGDTLWSIAGRVAPERDSRAEVATLQQLNHLRGVVLVPGQRLSVR